jgi:hypothetical protein
LKEKATRRPPLFLLLLTDLYFLRRMIFTATATTPAAASSGRMPGSGIISGGGPHDKPGSINKNAVTGFLLFHCLHLNLSVTMDSVTKQASFAPVIIINIWNMVLECHPMT